MLWFGNFLAGKIKVKVESKNCIPYVSEIFRLSEFEDLQKICRNEINDGDTNSLDLIKRFYLHLGIFRLEQENSESVLRIANEEMRLNF